MPSSPLHSCVLICFLPYPAFFTVFCPASRRPPPQTAFSFCKCHRLVHHHVGSDFVLAGRNHSLCPGIPLALASTHVYSRLHGDIQRGLHDKPRPRRRPRPVAHAPSQCQASTVHRRRPDRLDADCHHHAFPDDGYGDDEYHYRGDRDRFHRLQHVLLHVHRARYRNRHKHAHGDVYDLVFHHVHRDYHFGCPDARRLQAHNRHYRPPELQRDLGSHSSWRARDTRTP